MDLERMKAYQEGMLKLAQVDRAKAEAERARTEAIERMSEDERKVFFSELKKRKIKIMEKLMQIPADGITFHTAGVDQYRGKPIASYIDRDKVVQSQHRCTISRVITVPGMGNIIVSKKGITNRRDSYNKELEQKDEFIYYRTFHRQPDFDDDTTGLEVRVETSDGSYDPGYIASAEINPMANEDAPISVEGVAVSAESLDSLENIAKACGVRFQEEL